MAYVSLFVESILRHLFLVSPFREDKKSFSCADRISAVAVDQKEPLHWKSESSYVEQVLFFKEEYMLSTLNDHRTHWTFYLRRRGRIALVRVVHPQ